MGITMNNNPNDKDDVENILPASSAPVVTTGNPRDSMNSTSNTIPRLVTRNRIFSQSGNQVRVRHQYDGRIFWLMLKYDWFHLFLRGSIFQAMFILLGTWTGMISLFAGIYESIDRNTPGKNCGLATPPETISYHGAFAFSLETCKYQMTGAS
jgi:hypothetical protein